MCILVNHFFPSWTRCLDASLSDSSIVFWSLTWTFLHGLYGHTVCMLQGKKEVGLPWREVWMFETWEETGECTVNEDVTLYG